MKLETFLKTEDLHVFGIIAAILFLLYFLIGKAIKNSRLPNDQKRRTQGNLRTAFFLIFVISFFTIWATELYQFTLSVAAFGAALAIATKEVILNFGGSFYRTFARPFSVGDRIEINGIRGDVVDVGVMATQLLEVGPKDYTQQYTGRTIAIPNSTFLTAQVFNETDTAHDEDDFVLHVFQVPIKNDTSWKLHQDKLLEAAEESCNKYIPDAEKFFRKITKKRHVDMPWVEPRVNIRFTSPAELILFVRVAVPVPLKGTVEQEIIRNFLTKIH